LGKYDPTLTHSYIGDGTTVTWVEVQIFSSPEAYEVVGWLRESGLQGSWDDGTVVHLYWSADQWNETIRDEILRVINPRGTLEEKLLTVRGIADEDAGLSFFYAEVKRLKRVLDAAQESTNAPVLFLIDEIFKGTNNRERVIGSRAYIKSLADSNGFGLVTTHDLELAELEKQIPTASNAHFRERVEEKALAFDYLLRPGPCPTTNALRIMALEGLPVPEDEEGGHETFS